MKEPTARFSDRVNNYVKYRPSYPKEVIKVLEDNCGFTNHWTVADIGSGTGIFTKLLLEYGSKVFAVEPNAEMRQQAERTLNQYPNFTSINAAAEETSLADHSVQMITVAQAFHWFNKDKVRIEFERILNENGWTVLIWNNRSTETDFEKEYEQILIQHSEEYTKVNHRNITQDTIENFFHPGKVKTAVLKNSQIFGFDGLKGRLMSSSYAPKENTAAYGPMMKDLKKLYDKYSINDTITFSYNTEIYMGRFTS